jgi:hypothetical protein
MRRDDKRANKKRSRVEAAFKPVYKDDMFGLGYQPTQ